MQLSQGHSFSRFYEIIVRGKALPAVLRHMPQLLAILSGIIVWAIFRPGFVDGDTLAHLNAAATGQVSDWYSPAMPMALGWAGGGARGLSSVMLIQSILGSCGLFLLAVEVVRLLARGWLDDNQLNWSGLAVLVILLSPFTPLMYYLALYRNDTLAAVFLAWSIAYWLRTDRLMRMEKPTKLWPISLAIATAASIATVVVRYNAVVLVPVFMVMSSTVFWRTARKSVGVAVAAVLIIGPFLAHHALLRITDAKRMNPERQIMGLDLVGMCIERQELRAKLAYTSAHMLNDQITRGLYHHGIVTSIMPYCPKQYRVARKGYIDNFQRLSEEYREAIRIAPATWLVVKAKAAIASMFDSAPHWHHRVIDPNPHGIEFGPSEYGIRTILLELDAAIYNDIVLRFLCARYLPWMLMALCLFPILAVAAWRRRERWLILLALVVLIPLTYWASHMMAVAAHDFRYMFPAVLIVQVLVVSGIITLGISYIRWLSPKTVKGQTGADGGHDASG